MNNNATFYAAAFLKALVWLASLAFSVSTAQAQTAYGLVSGPLNTAKLVTFQVTAPRFFTATTTITGAGPGQVLAAIDSRPNTGELFALSYNPAVSQAQLYQLNATTGVLTMVGPTLALNLGPNGWRIGFDFDPTTDRIRVTGYNANYRLNPNNGALVATDTPLAYAATDANAAQTAGVSAVAYTNSYIGATSTALYDIDEANSRLVLQDPPNSGTLHTVGPLSFASSSDLDIYFNAATGTNQAYLITTSPIYLDYPQTALLTIDLATGALTPLGGLGRDTAATVVGDIALQITRTVPATVIGNLAYALAGTNLLSFDTALPGIIRTSVGVTGVDATQTLVGMDIRPLTNNLHALGYNATAQTYQLYKINSLTGVATAINATPIALALGTGKVGFDFNPTADRIRVTGANRTNVRLNPLDGTIAATDTQLAYATGDANAAATPNIGAVAYTNSVSGTTAATTTLYNYDLSLNILTTQSPPNNGTLNTLGATGITVNAATPNMDLDIYSSAAGTNMAYLVANTSTNANTRLYIVNLANGATTLIGAIGNGIAAHDIAVAGPTGLVTAVRERADLASGISLYPNPTSGNTALAFTLARAGRVELRVFDILGRQLATPAAAVVPAGPQTLSWNARTAKPGLYLMRLTVDGVPTATRQVVVE